MTLQTPTPTPAPAAPGSRVAIIATGAALVALSGPGQTVGFSVFVDPVTESFGISRSQLTAAYLVATLAAAPVGMLLGKRLDRHRLATMIRVVGGCLALALVLTAASPGLPVLALGVFGLRAFGQTGLTLTASVFVARAISDRRGAALGWLTAIGGAAITMTPLLASRLIPLVGWRATWLVLAAVVLAGSFGLAATASRSDRRRRLPADEIAPGLVTEPPLVDSVIEPAAVTADVEGTADPRQRRWAFAVVTAGFATVGGVGTALGFHQVAVLGERGLTPGQAATNFLPQSLAAAAVAVVVGRLVDRVPGRLVVPSVMVLLVAALSALRLVSTPATAVLFGVLLGAAAAANGASEGALLVRWTGTATLGRLRGRMMAVVVASTAIAPLWFTLLADAVGSFSRAATVTMVLPMGVAVLALMAPLPPGLRRHARA
jgi:MFS family permease